MGEHKLEKPSLFPGCPAKDGRKCQDCTHWLSDQEAEMALVNGQQWFMLSELKKQAIAQGQIVSTTGMITRLMSWCSLDPNWQLKAREQWCSHFAQRLAS